MRVLLREGDDPVHAAPQVREEAVTFNHEDCPPRYRGQIVLPGEGRAPKAVTVSLQIPRAPTRGELETSYDAWMTRPGLKALFGLAPMGYEWLRHVFEERRQRLAPRRHTFEALPVGQPSPAYRPDPPRAADDRPAVLVGLHWLEVGGAEKFAIDTVHWALEAGLRVFVVAAVPTFQRLAHKLPDHPEVEFLRLDRYLPQHLWPRYLEALVREENVRLVHIHHCTPLYASLPHLKITSPWLQVIDSTHIVENADGGYPRISAVHTNLIDMHHVISRELKRFYRDSVHQLGKVKLGRLLDRPEGPGELPPISLQGGQKTLKVAFVGRMVYQKRPVVLVRMLRAIKDWCGENGVTLEATVVGDGPIKPALDRLVRRYALSDCVTLKPGNVDVPALLGESDVLLLPSSNEGLALVCYEAIEQGCVPISTDVGAQGEIVPAELMVDWHPRSTIAGAVRIVAKLMSDEEFRTTCEAALHEKYRALASERTARQLLTGVYAAVARGETLTPGGRHEE